MSYKAVFKKEGHPDRCLLGPSSSPLIRSTAIGEGYKFHELYQYLIADLTFCEQELRWKPGKRRWFLILRAEQDRASSTPIARPTLSRPDLRARG